MATESVCLVIIFCILLGSHSLPSRSSAARILKGDDPSKIGVSGSTPHQDGSWSGHSSPSGNTQLSPPTSITESALDPAFTPNGTSGKRYLPYPRRSP
ncbi:hypothetical protein NL676_037770 [Syzygium grande]|nr:hypothetical protein NL676_037770 [Syzygium grande]